MTHRAESILAAVTTTVTGLTTTGAHVSRGRAYPTDQDAALTVNMGADTPVGSPNMAFQDMDLDVEIIAHCKTADGALDTTLNAIAAEVYAAMLADLTQGLGYVLDTRYAGREAPFRDREEKPVASQVSRYVIRYRHSYTSTES